MEILQVFFKDARKDILKDILKNIFKRYSRGGFMRPPRDFS